VWRAIATLFLDNAESQAVFVGTEFRSLMQGDMSIVRYFARLNEYADQLADLGFPVNDKAQVMNMFCGFNLRYFYTILVLTMQLPFPSFLRFHAFLILEELRLIMASAPPSDTALHATRAPPALTSNQGAPPVQGNTNNRNGNRKSRQGKGSSDRS
jgi:hypothetical protein